MKDSGTFFPGHGMLSTVTLEILLTPGFVDGNSDRVGQVQAAGLRKHRDAQALQRRN